MEVWKKLLGIKVAPWLAGLALFAVLAIHPHADAPWHFKDSAGFHFDAYSKIHTARNLVLFGETAREYDDWAPQVHSPVYTLVQWGVFKAFGVGLQQLRLAGMAGTAFGLVVLMNLLWREHGRAAAWLGCGFYAMNSVVYFGGRSGLIEPVLVGFGAGALWLAYRMFAHTKAASCFAWAAGVLAGLTICTKAVGVYYALAPLPLLLVPGLRNRRNALRYVAGAVITVLVFMGGVWLMNHDELLREVSYHGGKTELTNTEHHLLEQPLFLKLKHQHIPLSIALIFLPLMVPLCAAKFEKFRGTLLMASTLLMGVILMATVEYRPFRYYIPFMLPVCFLSAAVLARAWSWKGEVLWASRPPWSYTLLLWAGLTYVLDFGPLVFHRRASWMPSLNSWERLGAAGVLAVIAIGLVFLLIKIPGQRWKRLALRVALVLVFASHAKINGQDWSRWYGHPRQSIHQFSTWMKTDLHEATISGMSPNFSIIENSHYGLRWEETGVNRKPIVEGEWTHLVLSNYWKVHDKYQHILGRKRMERLVLLGSYPVINWSHAVYARELKPLICRYEAQAEKLMLTNMDKHTSQRAFGLSWSPDGGQLLHVADWWVTPGTSFTYAAPHPLLDGTLAVLPDTAWESPRYAGFNCEGFKLHRHPNGTDTEFLELTRRKLGNYHGSFTLKVEDEKPNRIFVWHSLGAKETREGLRVDFLQGDAEEEVPVVHSEHTGANTYVSAFLIKRSGIYRFSYRGRQAYSVLGYMHEPVSRMASLGQLIEGETFMAYSPRMWTGRPNKLFRGP